MNPVKIRNSNTYKKIWGIYAQLFILFQSLITNYEEIHIKFICFLKYEKKIKFLNFLKYITQKPSNHFKNHSMHKKC